MIRVMQKVKTKPLLVAVLLFAIVFGAVSIYFVHNDDDEALQWVVWQSKDICISESLSGHLSDRKFTILAKPGCGDDKIGNKTGSCLWSTKYDLLVQDALSADIDNDKKAELVLLVWKRGRYGNSRPFWIEKDEKDFSEHIFIYDIEDDGTVKEKWFASDIGEEVTRIKLIEKGQSVILTEGRSGKCSLWTWKSFGLKNVKNGVKIVAFGDNIIHKSIYEYAFMKEDGKFDFLYAPFEEEIKKADISCVMAETVLVDNKGAYGGYPSFGSPIEVGTALYNTGFDIVACANNHSLDRGIYGIDITKNFYDSHDMICVGIQNSEDKKYKNCEFISKNGITFAIFNYTYGTNGIDASEQYPYVVHYLPNDEAGEEELIKSLRSVREEGNDNVKADFVIVFVHWGDEYVSEVTDEQRHMAEVFSEGMADVVIGSHVHVIQDIEKINRKDGGEMLVYYGLGNFRADQNKGKTGIGIEAYLTVEYGYDRVYVSDYGHKEFSSYWKDGN